MLFSDLGSVHFTRPLVVRDGLAAAQWEAHWAAEQPGSPHAWITPGFRGYRAWRRDVWGRSRDAQQRALLSPAQSAALWRHVIETSRFAERLLDVAASARWAGYARQLLADWRIDLGSLRASEDQGDYRALLAWLHAYTERLEAHGWIDEAVALSTVQDVERAASGRLTLLDFFDSTPAQTELFGVLERSGWEILRAAPPKVAARAMRLRYPEPARELEAAARWAATRLERPRACVAVVVPDMRSRLDEIMRVLFDALSVRSSSDPRGSIGLQYGLPRHTQPLIGAALVGLELLTPGSTFVALSRWLRSPFYAQASRAALLEARLRSAIECQLDFATAYERGGLREKLEQALPEVAVGLARALREIRATGRAATPAAWARTWSRALAQLGWPASDVADDEPMLRVWEDALARVAQLTPVLGDISAGRALDELRAIVASPAAEPALPRFGVHVLDHIDVVGPGYDGVWVSGLTDQQWPERAQSNPLLPRKLQRAHGMPWAMPGDATARARASMERLLARTAEVVLSWPASVHEFAAEPSPTIRAFAFGEDGDLQLGERERGGRPERATERVEDRAPPVSEARIRGGARTLNLQARSPVRAFCETRLRARALEIPPRGLSARVQGIALHRGLELFVGTARTGAAMRTATASSTAARDCAEQSLVEVFGPARGPLAALFDLERDRLAAVIATFAAHEASRPMFAAVKLEERALIEVGPWLVQCRIDRVDELTDGSLVLIDYKTGRSMVSVNDWFGDRLSETQLPLYALEIGARLAGIMMVRIARGEVAYRGIAATPGSVAPSLRGLPEERSMAEQVGVWRTQIAHLLEEYARGDTRYFPDDREPAEGAYAPLTRIYASVSSAPEA